MVLAVSECIDIAAAVGSVLSAIANDGQHRYVEGGLEVTEEQVAAGRGSSRLIVCNVLTSAGD